MIKIFCTASALFILSGAALSHADPPVTALSSVRIYLSTTSFNTKFTISTSTISGLVSLGITYKSAKTILPSLVLDGYIPRSSGDPEINPSTNPTLSSPIRFWLASDLVKIGKPFNILVSTGTFSDYFIPPSIITRIERTFGEFDGHSAYGQPFYLPYEKAKLLKSGAPAYYCHAKYVSIPDIVFVSFDKKIGKDVLLPFCTRTHNNPPTDQEIGMLLKNKSVFMFGIPAD